MAAPADAGAVKPAVPAAPVTRVIEGRVIDEGGVPVAGAAVKLFDHAHLWLHDEQGDCAFSLLTCPRWTSGPEVLRRLDAGTLAFPEPVAEVNTDVEGRFRFAAVPEDTFLVIKRAPDTLLHELQDDDEVPLTLRLEAEERTRVIVVDGVPFVGGVPFVMISPFTRVSGVMVSEENGGEVRGQAARTAWMVALPEDGGRSTVAIPAQRWRLMRIGTPKSVDVRVVTEDGGAPGVEGPVTLDCDSRYPSFTDGGAAHFESVIAYNCKLIANWLDFAADQTQRIETWKGGLQTAVLTPRARLALSVTGAVGTGPLTASVRRPDDGASLSAFDPPWRTVTFDGGTTLISELPVSRAEVTVRGPGVAPRHEVISLDAGLNTLQLTLEASPSFSGRVRDAQGNAVAHAAVSAFLEGTTRWLGETRTDARGHFVLDVNTVENVHLVAESHRHGAASTTVSVSPDAGPVEFVLSAPRLLEVRTLRPDGGALRARVELATPEGEREVGMLPDNGDVRLMTYTDAWTPLEVDDGGVAREALLEAGLHVVRATAPGWVTKRQSVLVPDAGVAQVALVLEPGQVVQGTVRFLAQPAPGVYVWHEDAGVLSNDEGLFRFEDLAAGPLKLTFTNEDGSRTHSVKVTAPDQQVLVDLPE